MGGKLAFESDSVAGNVVAALAEEKPDEEKNRATKGKKSAFNRSGPRGGEENKSVGDAKGDSVEIAPCENDFFGEREIAASEGIFGAVVGMTEEFAVDEELDGATNEGVKNDNDQPSDKVDLKSKKSDLGGGEEDVGNHIELDSVTAVFGGFVFGERPFAGASAVKSVGKFGD